MGSTGFNKDHPSISNEVAQTLQVQGLSKQVAAEALANAGECWRWPTKDQASSQDLGLFKALLQKADDEISKTVVSAEEAPTYLKAFKDADAECLVYFGSTC